MAKNRQQIPGYQRAASFRGQGPPSPTLSTLQDLGCTPAYSGTPALLHTPEPWLLAMVASETIFARETTTTGSHCALGQLVATAHLGRSWRPDTYNTWAKRAQNSTDTYNVGVTSDTMAVSARSDPPRRPMEYR